MPFDTYLEAMTSLTFVDWRIHEVPKIKKDVREKNITFVLLPAPLRTLGMLLHYHSLFKILVVPGVAFLRSLAY